jgi:hypothetical protein
MASVRNARTITGIILIKCGFVLGLLWVPLFACAAGAFGDDAVTHRRVFALWSFRFTISLVSAWCIDVGVFLACVLSISYGLRLVFRAPTRRED